jgi:hypothetical protein
MEQNIDVWNPGRTTPMNAFQYLSTVILTRAYCQCFNLDHVPVSVLSVFSTTVNTKAGCFSPDNVSMYVLRLNSWRLQVVLLYYSCFHVYLWCSIPTRMCYPRVSGNWPEIDLYLLLFSMNDNANCMSDILYFSRTVRCSQHSFVFVIVLYYFRLAYGVSSPCRVTATFHRKRCCYC